MYRLSCAECSFDATADDVEEAYDVFEDHRERYGERHFVNIEKMTDPADSSQ